MSGSALIKLRRDTAANWTSANPVLAVGEPGFVTDTNDLKIGDGVTAWASLGYVGNVSDGDKGEITITSGVWAIDANAVTNAKLATMATARFKGRTTAGTGNVEDLTAAQATALLDAFTASDKGLAPASGGGTTNFLRADGSWAAPGTGATDSLSIGKALPLRSGVVLL